MQYTLLCTSSNNYKNGEGDGAVQYQWYRKASTLVWIVY